MNTNEFLNNNQSMVIDTFHNYNNDLNNESSAIDNLCSFLHTEYNILVGYYDLESFLWDELSDDYKVMYLETH